MKISELIETFVIWTTNEEKALLARLKHPVRLSRLNEHDQFKVQSLIRKSLVTKVGSNDPIVVANDRFE